MLLVHVAPIAQLLRLEFAHSSISGKRNFAEKPHIYLVLLASGQSKIRTNLVKYSGLHHVNSVDVIGRIENGHIYTYLFVNQQTDTCT